MRTTLSLEADVALRLMEIMKSTNRSMKDVVNEAMRIGLSAAPEGPGPRFEVLPHSFGLRPGIDADKLNQLLDEAEVDDFVGRPAARSAHA